MPKKLSKVVPRSEETALNANARAALRDDIYQEAASDKEAGELDAGAMETNRVALESDPMPEGKG